jgi:hypothetical protein
VEAIEHWPQEFRGIPPLETIVNGDGSRRLHFIRRYDGLVVFFIQELRRMETEGQEYFGWYPGWQSGYYSNLADAKRDAEEQFTWSQVSR